MRGKSFPSTNAMPELPEVEAARRAIEEHCVGKKIKRSVVADDAKVIEGVPPSDFEASLLGKTILAAHRKGKNMWLQLDSPPFPSFQFGMAGAIHIKGVAVTKYKRSAVKDTDKWPSKYSKIFIELDDGLELSFTDKRRFAKVRLLKDPATVPPISELGPDALLEPMTIDEFINSLSNRKTSIKALLLDQSYISGIGNWIADEVLYQARIHPQQIAATLSKESCNTLHKCIKEVIEKAIEVGADSSQFPDNWIFHSREKKPGKAFVDGKKIEFINAGGRTTAYVPELQKLSEKQAAKALGKPRKQPTSQRIKHNDNEDDDDDNDFDADDDTDDVDQQGKKTSDNAKLNKRSSGRGRGNRPLAKRKSNESDHDTDDNENDRYEEKMTWKSSKKNPNKVEKMAKQKVETSQKGQQSKKRAK